jgi:type VI secretion system secreted protein Hcp
VSTNDNSKALVDYFLYIENVQGESQDVNHAGLIQLTSWQWAEENSGRWGFGSGGGAGKVEMKDFEFRMVTNKASPKLFVMCATGTHIAQAKLICCKSGGGSMAKDFLTVTFSNCLISSFRTVGNLPLPGADANTVGTGAQVLPVDEIKINFARIQVEYHEQLNDGSLGPAITAGYDLQLNQAL